MKAIKPLLLAIVFTFHFISFAEFTDASLSFGRSVPLNTLSQNRDFTVAVWNIYKGKREGFKEEFSRLHRDSDLMLLQEAVLSPRQEKVFEVGGQSQWVLAESWETRQGATGTAILSTYRFHSPRGVKTLDTEPFANTPKTSLLLKLPIDGSHQSLLIVNTHSINFTFNGPFITQLEDLRGLISKHSGPVLWAGDFNTWSSPRKFYLREAIESLGLSAIHFKRDPRNLVLDHAFVRGISINEARVLSQYDSSDHWPLYLNLRLTPFSVVRNP